jgi:hypothetical protein
MHGMPPHIAQLAAGHRDINVTMGYKEDYLKVLSLIAAVKQYEIVIK